MTTAYDIGPIEGIFRKDTLLNHVVWDPQFIGGEFNLRLSGGTSAVNRGLSGAIQAVGGSTRYWRLTMSMNYLRPVHLRRYRAMVAEIIPNETLIKVPILDRYHPELPDLTGVPDIPYSDASTFSDGATFDKRYTFDVRRVLTEIQEGQNVMRVTEGYDGFLEGGTYFNIGNDLHMVTYRSNELSKSDPDNPIIQKVTPDGVSQTDPLEYVHFTPPARRTHTDPTIDPNPFLMCKMTSDASKDVPLEELLWVRPGLDFEEFVL